MGSIYGYDVETDLRLVRLNQAPGERGTIRVAASAPLPAPAAEPTSALVDDQGKSWYSSYELDGGCRLVLPPTGSFLLRPDELTILVDAEDDDAELLEHRLASTAICTLLAMRGDLVLHASGVARDGRCAVFCGPTGRGKSTLARALGGLGLSVLAEDGIAIELSGAGAPLAYPGARGIRARGPSGRRAETKLLADPAPEPAPTPVAAVVLLGERGEELAVDPVPAATALAMLTTHLVHSGGRDAIAAGFGRLAALLGEVPAFTCSLPDDLEALPGAATELLDRAMRPG